MQQFGEQGQGQEQGQEVYCKRPTTNTFVPPPPPPSFNPQQNQSIFVPPPLPFNQVQQVQSQSPTMEPPQRNPSQSCYQQECSPPPNLPPTMQPFCCCPPPQQQVSLPPMITQAPPIFSIPPPPMINQGMPSQMVLTQHVQQAVQLPGQTLPVLGQNPPYVPMVPVFMCGQQLHPTMYPVNQPQIALPSVPMDQESQIALPGPVEPQQKMKIVLPESIGYQQKQKITLPEPVEPRKVFHVEIPSAQTQNPFAMGYNGSPGKAYTSASLSPSPPPPLVPSQSFSSSFTSPPPPSPLPPPTSSDPSQYHYDCFSYQKYLHPTTSLNSIHFILFFFSPPFFPL